MRTIIATSRAPEGVSAQDRSPFLLLSASEVFAEDQQGHAHEGEGCSAIVLAAALDQPGRLQMLGPTQLHRIASAIPSLSVGRARRCGFAYNLKH